MEVRGNRRTSMSSSAMIALALLLVVCASVASARYLPTRSDDSRRERIKEVLRLMLDLSDAEAESPSGLRSQGPLLYELNGSAASRLSKRSAPRPDTTHSLETAA